MRRRVSIAMEAKRSLPFSGAGDARAADEETAVVRRGNLARRFLQEVVMKRLEDVLSQVRGGRCGLPIVLTQAATRGLHYPIAFGPMLPASTP